MSEAYRAAGSPRKVFMGLGPDREPRYYYARRERRERDRIRREIGSLRADGAWDRYKRGPFWPKGRDSKE